MPQITGDLAAAAQRLAAGQVVAIPTETVYGLAADARADAAVGRIFALKGRPQSHPLIVHLADPGQLAEFAAEIPPAARKLAAAFMPGPLTLLLPRREKVAAKAAAGGSLIGLRVPSHPLARRLISESGGALAAPSANRFGRISPTCAAHVAAEFADADDLLILDGGSCSIGIESTIVRIQGQAIEVVRPGAIGKAQLQEASGCAIGRFAAAVAAPGTLPGHYRPRQPLRMAGREDIAAAGPDCALVDFGKARPDDREKNRFVLPSEAQGAAREFYARLREAEASGCSRILVARPPPGEKWDAMRDRIWRAAGPG